MKSPHEIKIPLTSAPELRSHNANVITICTNSQNGKKENSTKLFNRNNFIQFRCLRIQRHTQTHQKQVDYRFKQRWLHIFNHQLGQRLSGTIYIYIYIYAFII